MFRVLQIFASIRVRSAIPTVSRTICVNLRNLRKKQSFDASPLAENERPLNAECRIPNPES